jgi:hypothetical protein
MIDRVAILLCLQNVEFLHAFPFKGRRIITAKRYDKVFVISSVSGSGMGEGRWRYDLNH